MKIKRLIALCLSLVLITALASCKGEGVGNQIEGKAKVIFELEGGTYKTSSEAVAHYYEVGEDGKLIFALDKIDQKLFPVERAGYELVGWYKTRTVEGDEVTYSDEWDFTSDKLTAEGVTLYARWEKLIKCEYVVCYFDEEGNAVPIKEKKYKKAENGENGDYVKDENGNYVKAENGDYVLDDEGTYYEVTKGEKFKDRRGYAEERDGWTFLGEYLTEEGEPWDNDFTHPGDEDNLIIKVVASYLPVEGEFLIVKTAEDLLGVKDTGKDIYLMNDIDMEGAELSFATFADRRFFGNGHTVSNFKISYEVHKNKLVANPNSDQTAANTLIISLFGNVRNVQIKKVNFTDFEVVIDGTELAKLDTLKNVYFAPIVGTVANSTIENLTASGKLICDRETLEGFESVDLITDGAYVKDLTDGESSFVNISVTVTEEQPIE